MESIKVNLIPNGTPEACHVSQYDTGRVIRLLLFEGLTPYTIKSGDTFTLNIRKPDNHIITASVSGTQGNNYLDITTTAQYCAVVGENLCEIRVANSGADIGSLNFIMKVERDVIADGIASDSVIEDLDELIAEAIGDDYYNKAETDALLDTKADKTDLLDVYPVLATTPAPIANFSTDLALPLKSCKVDIKPKQASGTPTPSNPLPISGTDTVIVTACGVNLWDEEWELGYIDTVTGQTASDTIHIRSKNYIPVTPSTTFYNKGYTLNILQYRADYSYIGNANTPQGTFTTAADCHYIKFYRTATTYGNDISINFPSTDTQYHAHVTATTKTVSLPSTVYGGEVDVIGGSGANTYSDKIDLGSLSWALSANNHFYATAPSIILTDLPLDEVPPISCEIFKTSSINDVYGKTSPNIITKGRTSHWGNNKIAVYAPDYANTDDFISAVSGKYVCYKVTTPTPITLANPIDLNAKAGVNNVFGDTDGNTSVEFRESVQKYIDDKIAAITPSNTPNLLTLNRPAINLEEANSPETDDTDDETSEER